MNTTGRDIRSLHAPEPPDALIAKESSRQLAAILGRGETARLRLIDRGQEITVPVVAIRLLADILENMAQGNAISIVPIHAELTTQEAADLLNVSRPYLVRLLEQGQIPFHKTGRHRRIRFADLRAYIERTDAASEAAAAELTAQAQELGLGY